MKKPQTKEQELAEGFGFIGGFLALILALVIATVLLLRFVKSKVDMKKIRRKEELKNLKPLKK